MCVAVVVVGCMCVCVVFVTVCLRVCGVCLYFGGGGDGSGV